MPSASQQGRPKLLKQSSSQQSSNRNIRDFFKPFTIPKSRIPANDVVEDEIVVASPRPQSSSSLSSIAPSQSSVWKSRSRSGVSTPTKGRISPSKTKHAHGLDGINEETLHHESPPCSQQRLVAAVEIPSPTKRPSPQPPAPVAMNTNNPTNTSFNSTSSLTSMQLSSQASSSRRIIKNGVPIVTNSDSGSAEDSEDELQDIVFQPRKRLRMTPPPAEAEAKDSAVEIPTTVKPSTRHSGRLSGKKSLGSSTSTTPARRASPEPTANLSAMMKLVREKEKREKEEGKIREAEAAFEAEEKRREEKEQKQRDLGGGLKALVADDSDEGERMMLAMERTEALKDEGEFFCFRGVREKSIAGEPKATDVMAFAPWSDAKFGRLKKTVLDARLREHACSSGFLAEIAAKYDLPPELMEWMYGQLLCEEREELCEAYVEVFRHYLQRADSHEVYLYARLDRGYYTAEEGKTPDQQHGPATSGEIPQGLRYVLRVVQYALTSDQSRVSPHLFAQVATASVDTRVVRDAALQSQFREVLAAIIDHTDSAELGRLAFAILNETTLSLPLRCGIIARLPAFTERCHALRRMLALHLVTGRPVPDVGKSKPILDSRLPRWVDFLLSRLRSGPEWTISESTNYLHLNALIPILDIAIDAGFPGERGLPFAPPIKEKGAFASKAPRQSDEESAFNAQVDALTDQLRLMSSRIRGAGPSHIRRAETKSALERLVVRLEHAVRTRPRPRKGVFGGGGGGEDEQSSLLSGFLTRIGEAGVNGKKDPRDRVSVVREDQLSEREEESDGDAGGVAEDDS